MVPPMEPSSSYNTTHETDARQTVSTVPRNSYIAGLLSRRLAEADGHIGGHARAERVGVRGLARVEDDLDGHALDHLHPVARRVLGRQQREPRARPRADRI